MDAFLPDGSISLSLLPHSRLPRIEHTNLTSDTELQDPDFANLFVASFMSCCLDTEEIGWTSRQVPPSPGFIDTGRCPSTALANDSK